MFRNIVIGLCILPDENDPSHRIQIPPIRSDVDMDIQGTTTPDYFEGKITYRDSSVLCGRVPKNLCDAHRKRINFEFVYISHMMNTKFSIYASRDLLIWSSEKFMLCGRSHIRSCSVLEDQICSHRNCSHIHSEHGIFITPGVPHGTHTELIVKKSGYTIKCDPEPAVITKRKRNSIKGWLGQIIKINFDGMWIYGWEIRAALDKINSYAEQLESPKSDEAKSIETKSLPKKLQQSGYICTVCHENSPAAIPVALNCGHIFCNSCAKICKICPICRKTVKTHLRIYM